MPLRKRLRSASPYEIFGNKPNINLLHWFDASDSSRVSGPKIRDKRDSSFAQNATAGMPNLTTFGGTQNVQAGTINGIPCAGLNGTSAGHLVLCAAGATTYSPISGGIGASTSSIWNTEDQAVFIAGVFTNTNTGTAGAAGSTFFSQNISDATSGRLLHCFRVYPDTYGTRGTTFWVKGTDRTIFDDTAIPQEAPAVITFLQRSGATPKQVLSACSRYINVGVNPNASYVAANEAAANFRIGARIGSGGSPTALMSGAFGELVVVTTTNIVGTILEEFANPVSGLAPKLLKNYFIEKWKLAEGAYLNF